MAGFLKRLFGGGGSDTQSDVSSKVPDDTHMDVEIRASPMKEGGGQWRIAGTLTKTIDGEKTVRKFVRADLVQNYDKAVITSVSKAKLIIDQNGAYIWKGDPDQPV